ncbi:acyl-CoA dehydrogenase family protein [Spirillospora sp. NPDC046719]
MLVPAEHGGLGGGLDELVDTSIALGRVDMSTAMIFAMHCRQTAVIVEHAGRRLAGEVLPQIAAGQLYQKAATRCAPEQPLLHKGQPYRCRGRSEESSSAGVDSGTRAGPVARPSGLA